MKLAVLHVLFSSALGLAVCLPLSRGLAADTNAAPATTSASDTSAQAAEPAAAQPAPAKLPYGVEDILKLSSSQVSEGIILTYIQNSGTIYSLSPQDIATLKSAGVSDNVVMAMVDQRRNVMAAAAQAAPPAAAQPAPVYTDMYAAPAPTYVQPAAPVTYVQPVPVPVPVYAEPYVDPTASTLYIIRSPSARQAYYGRPSSAGYMGYSYYGGGRGYCLARGWYGTRSGWHR